MNLTSGDRPPPPGPPNVRFYAGAPIITTENVKLGVLCVFDSRPMAIHQTEARLLANLTELITREIERDLLIQEQAWMATKAMDQNLRLQRAVEALTQPLLICDFDQPGWPVAYANQAFLLASRSSKAQVEGASFFSVFDNKDKDVEHRYREAVSARATFFMELRLTDTHGEVLKFDARLTSAEKPMEAIASECEPASSGRGREAA